MTKSHKQIIIITAAIIAISIPAVANAKENETEDTTRQSSKQTVEVTTDSTSQTTINSASSGSTQPNADTRQHNAQKLEQQVQQMKQERKQRQEQIAAQPDKKLDTPKKKICDNHQAEINTIMDSMAKNRQASFDRITKVSDAAQKYVSDKKITVANYDDLVAAVITAKTAASAAKNEQMAMPEFDCNSDKPHNDIQQFKQKRTASIDAMKVYRDSVKKLLSAIKDAAKPTATNKSSQGSKS